MGIWVISSFEIRQIVQLEIFLYSLFGELVHIPLLGVYLGGELLGY